MDFLQRYQEYEIQRSTTDQFIKDLMVYAEHIESKYREDTARLQLQVQNLNLDVEDAAKSRRELQQRLREVEARMGHVSLDNDHLKNHNPYVLVLIDADGLIFKEQLLRQGIEGGRKAANALRDVVAEHLTFANQTEIIAKVVANVPGLVSALKRDGSIDNEMDLKDFILGFNQARASFDFVDLGYGKQRADDKIKETARFHLGNYNCKQILLGISHDAGYAPFLEDVLCDNSARQRITVLEGYSTVRDITVTGVRIMKFQAIFRSERIIDRPSISAPSAPPSTSSVSSVSSPVPGHTPAISYATVTQTQQRGASPPPQITLPLAPKSTNTPRQPKPLPTAWNPGPRGLDTPIPLNQNVLDTIKRRKDSNKLCNNHYLRGPCAKGDDCCFEHDYKPNKEEKNAIAFLARLNPCTNGQDCDVENCIYGHHCPSVVNGVCTHPYCKFRVDEHPPGTKFKSAKV
ncbi:hypothetical protein F4780DRAFT_745036 [Xylariomycetidae sp. FL0641]|nr:hypothetical protein F4780DRAFT_745036 [Xylariomycetidae sp. FL0641]